jgi:hypothetical protein
MFSSTIDKYERNMSRIERRTTDVIAIVSVLFIRMDWQSFYQLHFELEDTLFSWSIIVVYSMEEHLSHLFIRWLHTLKDSRICTSMCSVVFFKMIIGMRSYRSRINVLTYRHAKWTIIRENSRLSMINST